MATLASTISRLGKNPLWVFAWGIFTMCAGYLVDHEYTEPERAAYFRLKTTELGNLSEEFRRADQMVEVWRKALGDLAQSATHLNSSVTAEALSPGNISETTQRIIDELASQRHMLDTPLVLLRGMNFEAASLQGLQAKLIQDLEAADQVALARAEFLTVMQKDLRAANELVPTIVSNVEEKRQALEADSRQSAAYSILERARVEFNDTLADAKAHQQMYHMRSWAAIAAWSYVGGFIGAVGGWKLSRLGRGRTRSRRTPEGGSSSNGSA